MNKRIISMFTAALLGASLLAGCSSAGNAQSGSGAASGGSGEVVALKGGCTNNPTSASFSYAESFANILEEVSGGKMTLEWHGGGTLGSTAQHYAQLKAGTLDMFSTGIDTATTLDGGTDFAAFVVPYMFNSAEHMEKFLDSDIMQEILAEVEPRNNVKFLGNICTSAPRGLSTTNTPVYVPEDVQGLRLRVPESPAIQEVWHRWGANPVQISANELYSALDGGMADGQDNNVLSMWNSAYCEVQKYYMELEYIQNPQVLWMSADTWNSLDETQQGWVMEAIAKAYEVNTADAEVEYEDSKAKCIEEGLEFIEFDRKAFEDSANEIAQEMDGEMFSAGLYDRIKALDAE